MDIFRPLKLMDERIFYCSNHATWNFTTGPTTVWWGKDLVVDFRLGFATTMLETTLLWEQGKESGINMGL